MRLPLLLFLSTILVVECSIPAMFRGRSPHKNLLGQPIQAFQNGAGATQAFFEQKIDHFGNSTATWTQRYFYSTKFAKGKFAFLHVDGEGLDDGTHLTDESLPLVQYANEFGAYLFSVEHRYYGASRPFDTMSVDNLLYLSAGQAVRDLANFITFANKQFNLPSDVRWVVFGGSYAGNLAAWLRERHPDLVVGAIASSAPLEAKLDFWEYNDQVEISIGRLGSTDCVQNINQGFKQAVQLMNTVEGRAQLSTLFNLTVPLANTSLSYNDIQQFYSSIYQYFQIVVQFNSDFNLTISQTCTIMSNTTNTNLQNIKSVIDYVQSIINPADFYALDNSYDSLIIGLQNETYSNGPSDGMRAWTWQTCTQFGYFTTTDVGENGIFGSTVPSNLFINQCADVFGSIFTSTLIRDMIEGHNTETGGSEGYTGTNIVLTNGDVDPWSRLGRHHSHDFSVVVFTIRNGSHVEDFIPRHENLTDLDTARQLVRTNVFNWLYGPINPVTNVNPIQPWVRPDSDTPPIRSARSASRFSKLAEDVPSKKTYPALKKQHKKVWLGRPPHGLLPAPDMDIAKDYNYPPGFEVGTFRQRVDHFDNMNTNYFQQKYFKNAQWAREGGPNFLMIGGEGPESERWVLNENITYLKFAQKYGATVYLLEHRYYGDSFVGDNTDLKYLSSLQMLYDLAEFIRAVNAQGNTAPWITFGGSYSGAMSAWMREVFPDLVLGAVGSSGPVFAKIDFYEYLIVVENSIRNYSFNCSSRIREAFDLMHQLVLTPEGRANLSDTFTLVPAWNTSSTVTELDLHYFFSNIYGNFQGAVQYSGDNTGPYAYGYGIPDMCKIMNNASRSALEAVADFNVYMSEFYQGVFEGTDNNYQDMIDSIVNAQQYGPSAGAGLLWTWQTCTEFGYFQSTDYGTGIFGSVTPVNMYTQMCTDVFNQFSAKTIEDSIRFTNYKYGSRNNYRGTNVVLPNGNVDPWHALGKYSINDPSVVPYLINGTAHCADMYPARDEDVAGLAEVRQLIDDNINNWLTGYVASTTVSPNATVSSSSPSSTTVATTTNGAMEHSLIYPIIAIIVSMLL